MKEDFYNLELFWHAWLSVIISKYVYVPLSLFLVLLILCPSSEIRIVAFGVTKVILNKAKIYVQTLINRLLTENSQRFFMTCRQLHIAVILISLLWHVTHTYRDIFSGSLINFTVVCRVPSEEVSLRGCDSIGRPLPHPRLGCLIGPPAASSQMKGTLLTPNLCRPWSVPHLSSTCTTGCRRERRGVSVCFLLVIVEVNGSRGMTRLRKQKTECLVSLCASSLFLCHLPRLPIPTTLFFVCLFCLSLFDSWIYIFYVSTFVSFCHWQKKTHGK